MTREAAANPYVQRLEVLQKVRDVAGGDLNLPQICVVGDQSSGKSSVLQLLTGVDFPVNAGICTKAPIVVECKRNPLISQSTFRIRQPESLKYKTCTANALAGEIRKVQDAALHKLGGGAKISTDEIRVEVLGPDCMDIIIVDLPGIIHQGIGCDETRKLIEKYINQEETLNLLVSEAKQDAELVTAIGMARQVDPHEKRTMRVLTKFDNFDSKDTERRAIELIRDSTAQKKMEPESVKRRRMCGSSPVTKAVPTMEDGSINRSGGEEEVEGVYLMPHAVICRPHGEQYCAEHEKRELIDKMHLPQASAGIASLKAKLPTIFSALISSNLPKLQAAIEQKLEKGHAELDSLGYEAVSSGMLLRNCQVALEGDHVHLEERLTIPLESLQQEIHASGQKITQEWCSAKLKSNVFTCPVFLGEKALQACTAEICSSWWLPVLDMYCREVTDNLTTHVPKSLEGLEDMTSRRLKDEIVIQWGAACRTMMSATRSKLHDHLKKEKEFGTMNHYFTAEFAADMAMPEELVDDFLGRVREEGFVTRQQATQQGAGAFGGSIFGAHQGGGVFGASQPSEQTQVVTKSLPEIEEYLRGQLSDARSAYKERFKAKTMVEQQKERLFAAVKALWKVESKTFTDIVLKETRDLLKSVDGWIKQELFMNSAIRESAVEDSDTALKREAARNLVERMQSCRAEIQRIC